MAQDVLVRVPVREQEPKVRATNFEEVCYGYNAEEAVSEASRCLNCKNAQCVKGCPVSINIPAFIEQVKNENYEAAYQIISESSALPAVCGRFAHRRASAKENVSEASRVIQFLLVSLSDLLLTGLERMESSQMEQRRRMVRRLQ